MSCRMPQGDNEVNYETDKVLARLSTLFGISNQATRVILIEIFIVKSFSNRYKLDENSFESFKIYNLFGNKHF